MLRVGLTGGIASGKSHVLARLSARGFHALDLDRIAHELMAPGAPVHAELVAAFGPGVLAHDGSLDRKRLGALVFADDQARERLNAIMHPRVRAEEERRAAAWRSEPGAVVVSDAALLVEAGVHLRFDRLVVVHCRPDQQLDRLMARDRLERRAAQARIDAQLPADEKRRFAHFVVDSSGSLAQTERHAERVADALVELARAPRPRLRFASERAAGALLRGPEHGPRGLTPTTVLELIVEAGGLELALLARRLEPPAAGPWYRTARPAETPGPETLSAAVVLWSLARGAPDPEFVLAAAASLARLTHREEPAIAAACLFARALLEVALAGRVPSDLPARAAGWDDDVRRWTGLTAAGLLRPVFESACRHASAAAPATSERGLPGALVGLVEGVQAGAGEKRLVEALARLAGPYG